MITAVSLNPSIDRTLTVDGFTPGGLNRVVGKRDVAAGKGINVALTVSALGLDAECIGFMYKDGNFKTPMENTVVVPAGGASVADGVITGTMNYLVAGVEEV